MKIEAKIKYREAYLPTKRHRIPRTREVEETVEVDLREVSKENAPVAMIVRDYQSYLDENKKDQFGLQDSAFLAIDNKLYREKRDMSGALDRGPYSLEWFSDDLNRYGNCSYSLNTSKSSKEDMLESLRTFVKSHVIIDGVIYQQTNEPRYVVMTFGLGHNHGGTALMITQDYNSNISKERYFSALDREKAIAYADEVAKARGDTKNVGTFDRDCNIRVFMPEMVRCNPQLEHGEGSSFMNSIEELIQGSDSITEAGLLVMSAISTVSSEIKPSLDKQIESASIQAAESYSDESLTFKDSSLER